MKDGNILQLDGARRRNVSELLRQRGGHVTELLARLPELRRQLVERAVPLGGRVLHPAVGVLDMRLGADVHRTALASSAKVEPRTARTAR